MTKEELEKQTMEWKNNYIQKLEKEKLGLKDYCDKYTKTILSLRHNVVDLEKEKAELEQKLEQTEKDLADYQFNYLTIKELEKENAELKEALKGKRCNCMTYLNFKDLEKECAKAKEIIKEFMKYEINEYDGSLEIHFEELKKQAEQFLSEVEK